LLTTEKGESKMATAMLEKQYEMEAEAEGIAISRKNKITPHGIPGKRLQMANFQTMKSADKYAKYKNPMVSDGRINAYR
jgi:hypothetical protein